MSEMIDIYEEQEKVILVAVELNENDDTESSLDELKELTDTVGALTVGRLIQKRDALQSGTYIGKGKVEELKEMIADTGATGIICDDELSPAQMKNLEELLETKIMDRTMLILDIFARHASTAEGKLQVEAAQLKYRLVRLVGLRSSMSRVSYGIGMRGPGEKKLEVDRRNIRNRISRLDEELKELQKNRSVSRARRMKSGVPVVAIVGYTNAGKSTLLNRLTGADILSADMLFATLDPTTRSYRLPGGQEVLLTDTVSIVSPHHLIDAFHSTLEEACYADIIIHMVDASNPEAEKQMSVVYETLKKLGVKEKPIITVFNKQDIAESQEVMKDLNANVTVKASAHTGLGMDELAKNIEKIILQNRLLVDTVLDFKDAGIVQQIRKEGALLEEEYLPSGIKVRAYVPKDLYGKIQSEINNR